MYKLLLVLTACATTQPLARARDFYPFSAGTTWVYEAKFLGGKVETRTVVLGPQQDGYYVDDAGGKLMYDGEGLRDERRYLLREPLQKGKRWKSTASLGAEEEYEIIRAHEACETKAGKWADCMEVRSRMPATDQRFLENRMTFAKGVGLVRIATALTKGLDQQPQVDVELVAFRKR